MADEVKFGKYKGRPVEDMLADSAYMQWLEGQPWFREKYSHILHLRDAEAASRTPTHNRMQARFLEEDYALAFVRVASPDERRLSLNSIDGEIASLIEKAQDRVNKLQESNEEYRAKGAADNGWYAESLARADREIEEKQKAITEAAGHVVAEAIKVSFEQDGADVSLVWRACQQPSLVYGYPFALAVEIKPTVGDEYPAVLRQMQRHKTRFLLTGRYVGDGVTQEQFVAIFAANGIRVVFEDDVQAELRR